MGRSIGLLAGLGILSMMPAFVAAESPGTPLEAFPDDVSVVARLARPDQTVKKIAELADATQWGLGGMVRTRALGRKGSPGVVGPLISNAELAGVDTSRDWWMGVFLNEGEPPSLVFAIPAKDLDAMEAAVGSELNFTRHASWGIYGEDQSAVDQCRARLKGEGRSVVAALSGPAQSHFDRGELGILVNVPSLRNSYRDQLESQQEWFENPRGGEDIPPAMKKAMIRVREYVKAVYRAIDDARCAVFSLSVSKQDIACDGALAFDSDSQTSKLLKSNPGSDQRDLALLPTAYSLYMGFDIPGLNFLNSDETAAVLNNPQFSEAARKLKSIRNGRYVSALQVAPKGGGVVGFLSLTATSDAVLDRKLTRVMYKDFEMPWMQGPNDPKPPRYKLQEDAEEFGDDMADVLSAELVFQDGNPALNQIIDEMMERIYGPEGLTIRTVYSNGTSVQTFGGGRDFMADALAALRAARDRTESTDSETAKPKPGTPEAARAAFESTRKKLHAKPNVIVLTDLLACMHKGVEFSAEQGLPTPGLDLASLEKIAKNASYLGLSLECQPEAINTRAVVPVEVLRGIAQLITTSATSQLFK